MPKVSIIIPVYNVEKYLHECLSSVLNQTYKNIEIICVNDGSTDSSLKILEEYKNNDNRIKIINQKNQGAGMARSLALKEVTGKYFMFLDSDDYYMNNTVLRMVEEIENDSDIDCVICNFKHENLKQNFKIKKEKTIKINSKNVSTVGCYLWNKIFKTSLLKKNNIEFPICRYLEDDIFIFKYMLIANKVKFITDKLLFYRLENPDSLGKQHNKKIKSEYQLSPISVVLEIYDYLVNNYSKCAYNMYFNFLFFIVFYWYPKLSIENKTVAQNLIYNKLKSWNLSYFSTKNQKTIKKCLTNKLYFHEFIENYYNNTKPFYFAYDFNRFYLKIFGLKLKIFIGGKNDHKYSI